MGFSGPLRISLAEVDAYCALHGIRGGDIDDLIHMIRLLDREWMAHWYGEKEKKQEAERKKADKSSKRPGRG